MATFGKTTTGSSSSASSAPRVWCSTATPAASGTVQGGSARIWLDASGSTSVKMALYADSSGAPGALLAESDAVTFTSTTEGNQAFTFSGVNQVTVTAGVAYWIAVAWNDPGTPSINVSRDGTATSRREQTVASWPTLPNPYGTPTANNTGPIVASITYTESGGGGGGTVPVVRSTSSNGETNTPTVSVSKPSGLAVGDYLLAFQESDADGTLAVMTAPSGFTELSSQAPDAVINIPAAKLWGKVAVQADVDATTFSFPDNTGANCSVVLLAIQVGTYDPTTPISTPSWATQGDAVGTDITAPSITGAVDALLLTAHMPDTGGTLRSFSSGPAGMTLTVQSTAGTSVYTRIGVYQQTLTSGGATGTKTAVLSASPNGWVATALLINPAPTGVNLARRTGGFLTLL